MLFSSVRRLRLFLLFLLIPVLTVLVAAGSVSSGEKNLPPVPETERRVVVDTLHGIEIEDPYRWLEDQESEQTRDWLEAGTPLIKSEGIEIVRILRETFPQKTIVADLKTMDTGALETEMAAKAGADIVCVMAASDDSTIKEAVASAHKYGTKIMVDLLGV
ncbi:MAG: orotidine 5'-phosphate decarboxylase / HUMPS family protein, partial [Candidatus Krumholzibacteriales bacterium]